MKCLIIAAGYGSRLRSISGSKPLALLAGMPLIEHVIRRALAGGATEFLVVTGHEADRIEQFLAGLAAWLNVPLKAVRTPNWDLPNGYSVVTGAGCIEGYYLLLMSDHLFDPEIVAELLRQSKRPLIGLILAVDRHITNPALDLEDATRVETAEDGSIVRIGKGLDRYDAIDTGVFLATPALREAILTSVERGGVGSLSAGVQLLADQKRAQTMDVGSCWWADVDDPESFSSVEEELEKQALIGGNPASGWGGASRD